MSKVDVKEKLADIIQNSVGGCARHWAEIIADGLIANGVTVQDGKDANVPTKWISVKDRLPDYDGIYLTFSKKKEYEFHLFQTGKRMWQGIWEEDGVTHWMPLPQPPKGGEKDAN